VLRNQVESPEPVHPEPVEGPSFLFYKTKAEGFDKLGPNGDEAV
jgi:hypothetical protein